MVHRLVARHFCDGYFPDAVVNHKDGNNRNNMSENLEWVTQKENIHKSYVTSGVGQTRNYKMWVLLDPHGKQMGVFKGHYELEKFVRENGLNTSASSLTKYGTSNGYNVIKIDKQAKNCNDYRNRVHIE